MCNGCHASRLREHAVRRGNFQSIGTRSKLFGLGEKYLRGCFDRGAINDKQGYVIALREVTISGLKHRQKYEHEAQASGPTHHPSGEGQVGLKEALI